MRRTPEQMDSEEEANEGGEGFCSLKLNTLKSFLSRALRCFYHASASADWVSDMFAARLPACAGASTSHTINGLLTISYADSCSE
ncbi:hypothetical protein AVEN_74645-1 [Araneus ventricosus]|uniref:Uncharacterized protein n=1 Tax=Araneus ventricosus TaxID=182803 RepID=A0A4Y2F1D0_ARAVE|nr:hypothetical protein AVEN_74645-1 [Araneus ventricosus]